MTVTVRGRQQENGPLASPLTPLARLAGGAAFTSVPEVYGWYDRPPLNLSQAVALTIPFPLGPSCAEVPPVDLSVPLWLARAARRCDGAALRAGLFADLAGVACSPR